MQLENPHDHVGSNVRIRSHGSSQHFGRGKLLAVKGEHGVVQPFQRHRQIELIPLTDIHTWAAGNAVKARTQEMTNPVEPSPNADAPQRYVLADTTTAKFFASSWYGFRPELNSAKVYDQLESANRAAGRLRSARVSEVSEVRVLTVGEAQELLRQRFHQETPAEPAPAVQVDEQPEPVTVSHVPMLQTFDLTQARPDDLRAASEILRRMADADAMYREANAELEKVRAEWQTLQQQLVEGGK